MGEHLERILRGHRCDRSRHPTTRRLVRRRLLGIGLGGAAVSLLPFLSGRASATTPPNSTSDRPPPAPRPRRHLRSGRPTTTLPCSVSPSPSSSLRASCTTWHLAPTGFRRESARPSSPRSASRTTPTPQRCPPSSAARRRKQATRSSTTSSRRSAATWPTCSTPRTRSSRLPSPRTTTSSASCRAPTGRRCIASILIVEARHGTVLAYLNGKTDLDDLLVNTEADALDAGGRVRL